MGTSKVVDRRQGNSLRRIRVGIGCFNESVDVDMSAVSFSSHGILLGSTTRHLSGEKASGSFDEAITVDLSQIPTDVSQIFFVMNVRSNGATSSKLEHGYAHVSDQTFAELARFDLRGGCPDTGLIIARLICAADATDGTGASLFIDSDGESGVIAGITRLFSTGKVGVGASAGGNTRWRFEALGLACHGPTWKEAETQIVGIICQKLEEVTEKKRASTVKESRIRLSHCACSEAPPAAVPTSKPTEAHTIDSAALDVEQGGFAPFRVSRSNPVAIEQKDLLAELARVPHPPPTGLPVLLGRDRRAVIVATVAGVALPPQKVPSLRPVLCLDEDLSEMQEDIVVLHDMTVEQSFRGGCDGPEWHACF
eukprot:TRINITY_DN35381_c0_g2_i1.p1 TRINITY_DN35381_c0_g2~~TRINITY_DN35381_c0_g2_i1.p1  ORF type:complete len:367 (-),score=44.12 TRINITY_DN35381_c0_g2_i1:229-1329(-)